MLSAFFLFYVLICVMVGLSAQRKNRYGIGFFLLSFFFSPILGGIIVMCLAPVESKKGTRKCPYCAERIKKEALICKHCGQNVPVEEVPQEIEIYESLDFDKKAGPFNKRVSEISGINLAIILSALLLLFFLFAPFNG